MNKLYVYHWHTLTSLYNDYKSESTYKIGMSHINSEFLTSILKSRWYGDIGPLFLPYSLGLNSSCSLWKQSDDSGPRTSPWLVPFRLLHLCYLSDPYGHLCFPLDKDKWINRCREKSPHLYWILLIYTGVQELDSPWFKPRIAFFMDPGV